MFRYRLNKKKDSLFLREFKLEHNERMCKHYRKPLRRLIARWQLKRVRKLMDKENR